MSIEFKPRPVRGSRGPGAWPLLVIGLLVLLGAAVVKPWDSGPARPLRSSPPAHSPSIDAPAPASPVVADLFDPWANAPESVRLLVARWDQVAEELPFHDRLGIRVISAHGPVSGQGSDAADPGTPIPILDGALIERWYPAPDRPDAGWQAPVLMLAGVTAERPALALAITTASGDAALDVRLWYLAAAAEPAPPSPDPQPLALAFRLDQDGADGLLMPNFGPGDAWAWPAGRFVAEVLLGSRIVAVPFEIPAGPPFADPNAGEVAERTFVLSADAVGTALRFAEGPIRIDPTGRGQYVPIEADRSYVFTIQPSGHSALFVARAGPRLDSYAAWLATGDALDPQQGPSVLPVWAERATVLGVTLPPGTLVQSATLWRVAPAVQELDATRIEGDVALPAASDALPGPAASDGPRRFVAFVNPDGRDWPGGIYRIALRATTETAAANELNWHVAVGGASSNWTLAREAAGRWAGLEPRWSVLSARTTPPILRPLGQTIWTALEPRVDASDPDRLGEVCAGAAQVDRRTRVIGLRIPDGIALSSVRLIRRFEDGLALVVPTQRTLIVSLGLALILPARSAKPFWPAGFYDLEIALAADAARGQPASAAPRFLPICIGAIGAGPSAFRVATDSASRAAYEVALAMPGVTMLAP